jgi:hypothetical protein
LLCCIQQHPILLNRPFVITPLGVRLCRPSEVVLDILPCPQQGPFIKEDGAVVIDAKGRLPADRGKLFVLHPAAPLLGEFAKAGLGACLGVKGRVQGSISAAEDLP